MDVCVKYMVCSMVGNAVTRAEVNDATGRSELKQPLPRIKTRRMPDAFAFSASSSASTTTRGDGHSLEKLGSCFGCAGCESGKCKVVWGVRVELSLTVSPWGLGPWFASRGMSHVTWFALSFVRANTLFHGPWI